jgi:hypothetical protein
LEVVIMLNSDIYPHIFTRKAIRKYAEAPLSAEQTGVIRDAIGGLAPLFPDEKYQLEFAPAKQRVYAYGENTITGNANVGFLLQQLDLALFGAGLGRLWYGTGREPKDIKPTPPLTYVICLKVGVAAEPLARQTSAEFDRKPLSEVTADEELQNVFAAVRLVPSARNMQPWQFVREGDAIHAFHKKPGLIAAALLGRMSQSDMGIALCHAVLALEHEGYTIKDISAHAQVSIPDGYEYTATIMI